MVEQFLPTISSLVALGEFSPVAAGLHESPSEESPSAISHDPGTVGSNSSGYRAKQQQDQRAETEWQGAVTAVRQLLQQTLQMSSPQSSGAVGEGPAHRRSKGSTQTQGFQGVMLSGPFPVLDSPELTKSLANWTFIPQPLAQLSLTFGQLMPAEDIPPPVDTPAARLLPLIEGDPLVAERFCLVLTAHFSLVIVLGKDANDELHFQFSFTPQVIESVWALLRSRIVLTQSRQLDYLEPLVAAFAPVAPDYRLVSQFSRYLLSALPALKSPTGSGQATVSHSTAPFRSTAMTETAITTASFLTTPMAVTGHQVQPPHAHPSAVPPPGHPPESDAELLKAMAHEIRTPLTTIRTLTRSLLRRKSLDPNIQKRLQQIDRECTQQINRFNLIFKAVELETTAYKSPRSPLTATSLSQLFQESIPQWQQAATRRNLELEVSLPTKLPMVASDPALLQQVLTGLVELYTHSISPSSHIHLQVMAAGHQLKLQFQSQRESVETDPVTANACQPPPLKSLGHLLMFQPDTGGLSLNLETTKSLFQALGAKLTIRERHNQGATWTVFLPIETADYPIV
jgi:hypothetical protein